MQRFFPKPSTSDRTKEIKRVLWVVFALNLAVALAKITYGIISNSASMKADGIHSIFDSAGNIVGLVGISLAARPADDSHPYGHSKFETYASLLVGVLLLIAAFEVGYSATEKIQSGIYATQVTPVSFVVMLGTLAINIGVTCYERRRSVDLKSEILAADAGHTLSDALVSLGVIVGLVFVSLGYPIADPLMALVVTVAILKTAYEVFARGLSTLSDHSRMPDAQLKEVVLAVPGVRAAHRIRTRGTEGEVYADLHVLVSPEMTVLEAHNLADNVENAVQSRFPNVVDVLVHIEPDDGHEE